MMMYFMLLSWLGILDADVYYCMAGYLPGDVS
jgi:hypothetical protein